MPEIRLQIPESIVSELQAKLGQNVKATDMAKDAMTLFNWAVRERAAGRVVLSSESSGADIKQITMPSLEAIVVRK